MSAGDETLEDENTVGFEVDDRLKELIEAAFAKGLRGMDAMADAIFVYRMENGEPPHPTDPGYMKA